MKRLLLSTTGWAMVLCLLAAVSPLMAWRYVYVPGHIKSVPDWQTHQSRSVWIEAHEAPVSGYGGWEAPAINIVAGLGFMFVFATGALRPVPWWRSLGISVVGVGVVVIVLLCRAWRDFSIDEWGPLLAILSSAGLVLIAVLEVRQLIASRLASKSQPRGETSGNPT